MNKNHIFVIGPSIAYLSLTKDKYSLVDLEDMEYLTKYSWNADKGSKSNVFYARGIVNNKLTRLHRIFHPESEMVDHINGNTLDNRKANLRQASNQQNQANSSIRVDNKTGYKGVTYSSDCTNNPYIATTRVNKKKFYIGSFSSAEEASTAYKKFNLQLHGKYASHQREV